MFRPLRLSFTVVSNASVALDSFKISKMAATGLLERNNHWYYGSTTSLLKILGKEKEFGENAPKLQDFRNKIFSFDDLSKFYFLYPKFLTASELSNSSEACLAPLVHHLSHHLVILNEFGIVFPPCAVHIQLGVV